MILTSPNVLILFQVISEVAFESGPIGDEELARLCAPSCFPVMNLRQYVEWDGAGPDICAKFEVLDSICEKHLEALRTRLALLKTFRFLWVSGARTVSGPGGVTSALEQSGFTEVSLRLKIFELFDELVVGTPVRCLQRISESFMALSERWMQFKYPEVVQVGLIARVIRLGKTGKFFFIEY